MKTLVKGKASRVLARVVLVVFLCPMVGATLGAAAAHAQPPQTVSLVVFPLEDEAAVGGPELAERVTHALKRALADSGRVTVWSVDLSSPTVQRAIHVEKTLTEEDFNLPMERGRAARIAQALGVQYAFMGSLSYRFDTEKTQASITLSVQQVDAATGETMLIGVAGRSSPREGAKEGPAMTEAIDAAVHQVVEKAFGPAEKPSKPSTSKPPKPPKPAPAPAPDKPEKPEKKVKGEWLAGLLLLLLLL